MTAPTTPEFSLSVQRTLRAPIERVFAAWTDPAALQAWFHPHPAMTTPIAEVDLREGGAYRLGMKDPESGELHIVAGQFTTVRPPEKLVFTWRWQNKSPEESSDHDMIVTIDLKANAQKGTDLILTHDRLPNEGQRDHHEQGWNGCLASLETHLTSD